MVYFKEIASVKCLTVSYTTVLSNQAGYISVTFIKYHPQSLPFFPKGYLLSFIYSPLDESFKIIMWLVAKLCLTLGTSWTV